MDITERKITKIAREAEKLVLRTMRETGVGTAEIDLIHALRHNPGCTQAAPSPAERKIWKRRATSSAGTPPTTGAVSCCTPRKRRRT